ncbi:MAG TPA: MXAN_5187 C-terminal domain-containing protein [Kofleriaceae bacterium]|nr:MXAN_5187 C-terminal domain-containing protein [Kofleriaceae bacterium]
MSRTVIAAVVAVVIAALTAIAFFVTKTSFEDKIRKDAEAQLRRSYQVVQQLAQLEAIDVANKAERLAADKAFVLALKSESAMERANQARVGMTKFTSNEKEGDVKPDMIALVDANGLLVAMNDVASVVPKQFQKEGAKPGETTIPALNVVLGSRVIISDIWNDRGRMMKIGVAPIIDADAPVPANDPDGVVIIGAVIVAYAQTAQQAQMDKRLLGTEIAYYDQQRVVATSFTKGGTNEEDTAKATQLSELVRSGKIKEGSDKPTKVSIDGVTYYGAAVQMPRSTTNARRMPQDYPAVTAGAMVLASAGDSVIAGGIKMFIILLGLGALAISMLGLYLTHRRLVAQVDQIELGVTDIINGNVDRTFRPVGAELDGLANGLNVMLARLLGRPEPGEEEFDEEGNPIIPGRVDFEEGEEKPAVDPDLANLAKESEPDYYKRVFTEYVAARKAAGSPDDVSFENFIAKLKVNEGKLKAQYNCRAVRFRVVTKDGKVSLKPVPIFE